MSAAPSPRRGLPLPSAVTHPVDGAAAAPAEEGGRGVAAVTSQSRQASRITTYVFRKPPVGSSHRRTTTTTSTSATRPLPSQRNEDADDGDANTHARSSDTGCFARPSAATFPWSSRSAPSQPKAEVVTALINSGANSTAEGAAFVDLSATPEKQRRRPGMGSSKDEESEHLSQPPPPKFSSQYVDPAADNGAAGAQAGDSSLVFALSEDNELKVLASRVGPPAPSAPSGVRSLPVSHASTATQAANQRRVAAAAELPISMANAGNASGASQLQTHTPSVHRVTRDGDKEVENSRGPTYAAKPLVQAAHPALSTQQHLQPQPQHVSSVGTSSGSASTSPQPQPPVSSKTTRTSTGAAPLYRSNAHELPSPPALHVCPGGIPGTSVMLQPSVVTSSSTSSHNARWTSSGIPSVSLCATSAPPPPPPTTVSTAAAAAAPLQQQRAAGSGAVAGQLTGHSSRSNVSSAAPEGSGSVKSCHRKTLSSTDARSQHSGTPPPAVTAPQPIDKNFTAAQLETVRKEVQQELYLNYSAVPIPADMINLGDTDERRRRLEQRQKQIVYGKETEGYAKYTCVVPRPCDREYHNPLHALTPRPEYDCSKRQFDRVLNAWRRQLHQWDDCDLDHPEAKFLPSGKATLLDLALAEAPVSTTHTPTHAAEAEPPPPPQPSGGVMHSIANVAAMAHVRDKAATGPGGGVGARHEDDDDEDGAVSHTRSPVFTGNTPTSGLYSSGLSMHLNSGRASAITAAACTPSRPQMSEGAEGPQVDDSFFLHMNSGSSRIASPFHPTYSGTGHVANANSSGAGNAYYYSNYNSGPAGPTNGRASTSSCYQQFMRNNSYVHHSSSTPGGNHATHTGLTPAHRPPSCSSAPHHITAIFGSEYELMTPSGPGSPSGMPHNPRSGGSPYRLGEPWMSSRRSPTYVVATAAAAAAQQNMGHATSHNSNNGSVVHNGSVTMSTPVNSVMPSNITAVNSAGTMVLTTGARGESPPQTTELALIPSTSQSSGGGFAQSPYGFRVHSPVQPQQQQQSSSQPAAAAAGTACATPLTRSQSRPGMITTASPMLSSPSRSPIGLPQQQQQQRVTIATTMAAATRSRRGSGIGVAPTTWTPPNPQAQVRPSPNTPQLHLSAGSTSTKRSEAQE